MTRRLPRTSPLTLLSAFGLASLSLATLAGCATPSETTHSEKAPSASGSAAALTIQNCGRELTFSSVPSRVVILGGASVAEINSFVALGIQPSIIANLQGYGVSDDPSFVAEISTIPAAGLTVNENYGPPAEQLLTLTPDLVVSTNAGGFDAGLGFATRDELAAIGANTLITPTNCAGGNPRATSEETERYDAAGIGASYELLRTLGQVFHVEDRAEKVIASMQNQLDSVTAALGTDQTVGGIVLSPGFGTDVPTAWTGGIVDEVLEHAGVQNAFEGQPVDAAGSFSAEQLLVAEPSVVVLFGDDTVDFAALKARVAKQFPNWPAVRSRSFVTVYDGAYLGPTNALAVEKIARVAHPDAF